MDLYIRSKDRMQIEKMRRIQYEPLSKFNFHTGTSENKDNGTILVNGRNFGEYTKEQALEILNDIQEILTPIKPIDFTAEELQTQKVVELLKENQTITILNRQSPIQELSTTIYELPDFDK